MARGSETASDASVGGVEYDFRTIAFYFNSRPKRLGCLGQTLEDIACPRARCGRGQTPRIQKTIVRVLAVRVGLAFAEIIQDDRSEGNRLEFPTVKLDVCDYALPAHRLVDVCECRRHVVNEIAQVIENRM